MTVRIPVRSRIHLLPAREAPIIVILQRKRTKLFHVVTLDTETHAIDEGSWFRGVLDPLDCDVSFDGKFMVYSATSYPFKKWSGVCRLPWLKTLVHVVNPITGGGYFSGPNDLKTHGWDHAEKIVSSDDIPFTIERDDKRHLGDEFAVIYGRLERDGFTRLGGGEDGWGPGGPLPPGYPELQLRDLDFFNSQFRFAITLDEYPDLLVGANWATLGLQGIIFGSSDPASSSNTRSTICGAARRRSRSTSTASSHRRSRPRDVSTAL